MTCSRCQGLMVGDDLIDLQESYVPMWMCGWRCVACGNIVDPLIQRHRMQRAGAPDATPCMPMAPREEERRSANNRPRILQPLSRYVRVQ